MAVKAAFRIAGVALALWLGVGHTPAAAEVGRRSEGEAMTSGRWSGKPGKEWKNYERLVEEQKFQEALETAEGVLEKARASNDTERWARALIRAAQLRVGLHGYEGAVRFLKEEPWPEDLLGNAVLELYYARCLVAYGQAYSWEIRKRERVEAKGAVDLKAWTMEQIHSEARGAYLAVWSRRDRLGGARVQDLAEFVQPNTYPDGIRSTLRDAVSYLFVEFLADTAGWRPEELNELFALDLGALLANPPEDSGDLADLRLHPLAKICAVLGDLEEWHRGKGERAAALEARLARLRQLRAHFTRPEDRERLKKNLEGALAETRDVSWWAVGMALLAEVTREDDAPDNLVRARAVALEGQTAYPGEVGGVQCGSIVASIEAPEYQLEGMAADGPSKRSIGVRYKNLDEMTFRAYRLDIQKRIESAQDYNLYPEGRELEGYLRGRPAYEWTQALAPTTDFKVHRAYPTPPIEKPGFYVVVASARKDFNREENQLRAVVLGVGDLVLLTRQEGGEIEVTAVSGASGRPVAGADVFLYRYDWQKKHRVQETRRTGPDGTARFDRREDQGMYFFLGRAGEDFALDPNYVRFYRQLKPSETAAALLFTDRSIYRPLQKLYWKAVVYRGRADQGRLRTDPGATVTVSLVDANRQTVDTQTAAANAFGTAAGEFTIPAGRLLGQWTLQASPPGHTQVRVEEYKRPTFEAKLLPAEAPYRLNRPAAVAGEARYYFGLPLTAGSVRWRAVRTPVYPPWWGWWYGGEAEPGTRSQTVAAGTAELGPDGRFTFRFTPKADERLADGRGITYRYEVTADVTDEGGETRTATRSFRLGFVSVEATVRSEVEFFREGEPAEVKVFRADLDGAPAPGKGAWQLVRLAGPEAALLPADQPVAAPRAGSLQTPDDRIRPRWNPGYSPDAVLRSWADGEELARGEVPHGEKGEGPVRLPALAAGAYRLKYQTTDPFGSAYEMTKEIVVGGPAQSIPLTRVPALPPDTGHPAHIPLPGMLLVERSSVPVGDTARVLLVSGLEAQPLVLDRYRGGVRVQRKFLEAGRDPGLVEIPVAEEDRGGFAVVLTALRDHQLMTFSKTVFVPWDDKELKVEFSTFRDKLRPGQGETWTVKVTGPEGAGKDSAGQAAELLAYMYDRSLDLFAPHVPASPLRLYPYRAAGVLPRPTLGQARQLWVESRGFRAATGHPALEGDRLRFYDGYGIGGPGRRARMALGRADGAGPIPPPAAAPMAAMKAEAPAEEKSAVAPSEPKESEPVAAAEAVAPQAPERPVELRRDFSETAFWIPQLLTGPDGSAALQFEVPDSVTSWSVWVHAVTRDMKAGSVSREARSAKDLMVRPYLPRFLREGDRAELKVVVNNASDRELKGVLTLDVLDPATQASVLETFGVGREEARRAFAVAPGGGTSLAFPVTAPPGVRTVALKVAAVSGDVSDGELRPIPVLPGRVHLAQSRFAVLKGPGRRELAFADLARDDDPSRINEQLVVTIDAQLFYSVLSALPYLVNYPYECTEQTLNRFLSTGILTSLYRDYPAVARMAKEFSARRTRLETWDAADPNRKMALEESPWLREAKGGAEAEEDLLNVLDPEVARANRESSLAKLRKAQTSSGGFPWFPGGPPSPYMTLYLLHGFSKGLEFGVDVPQEAIQRAWQYLHQHYVNEVVRQMMGRDCCWEFVTFLNYVLSNYPDASWTGGVFSEAERRSMLDFSFRRWKRHSPYLKGYLALTLRRTARPDDAKLVWQSVMDSAKSAEDQGTFWAPEDGGWLWYNDTIETHAFAVRTELELDPQDPKLDGLVLWLLLNKKLNHWKSTKATSEVIYSLAHYLKRTGQLGVREDATVTVGNQKTSFVFEPDRYTGKKSQVVIPGEKVDPKTTSTVAVEKSAPGYLFASATWHFSTERPPEEAGGDYLSVSRSFFKRVGSGQGATLEPLADGAALRPGDQVEVRLSLTAKHPMEYVHLRDPRAAGFEPESAVSRYKWDLGIGWYEEVRDSGTNFFFDGLPQGEYTFKYRIRAATAGTFKASPATVQPLYAPEFAAYSTGAVVRIEGGKE